MLQVRTQMFLQVWGSRGGPQGELELERAPFPGSGLGLLCSWKNPKVKAGEHCLFRFCLLNFSNSSNNNNKKQQHIFLLGELWRKMKEEVCVYSAVSDGSAEELPWVSCHYFTHAVQQEALSLSSWSCSTLYKQLTFNRRETGAQELSSIWRRPTRLLIHTHMCVLNE